MVGGKRNSGLFVLVVLACALTARAQDGQNGGKGDCYDIAPPGCPFTCEEQYARGQCRTERMMDTKEHSSGYCAKTCGACLTDGPPPVGGICTCSDEQPPKSKFNCVAQKAFGKCNEKWMRDTSKNPDGYCAQTCGVCKCEDKDLPCPAPQCPCPCPDSAKTDPPASQSPPEPTPPEPTPPEPTPPEPTPPEPTPPEPTPPEPTPPEPTPPEPTPPEPTPPEPTPPEPTPPEPTPPEPTPPEPTPPEPTPPEPTPPEPTPPEPTPPEPKPPAPKPPAPKPPAPKPPAPKPPPIAPPEEIAEGDTSAPREPDAPLEQGGACPDKLFVSYTDEVVTEVARDDDDGFESVEFLRPEVGPDQALFGSILSVNGERSDKFITVDSKTPDTVAIPPTNYKEIWKGDGESLWQAVCPTGFHAVTDFAREGTGADADPSKLDAAQRPCIVDCCLEICPAAWFADDRLDHPNPFPFFKQIRGKKDVERYGVANSRQRSGFFGAYEEQVTVQRYCLKPECVEGGDAYDS